MTFRFLIYLLIVAFLLNFAWEFFQASLFSFGTPKSFWWCALRDALMVLALYLAVAAVVKNWRWGRRLSRPRLILLWVLGAVWAIALEYFSLESGRWAYTSAMPLIPFLKVGLLPVLQLIILPIAAILLTRRNLVD